MLVQIWTHAQVPLAMDVVDSGTSCAGILLLWSEFVYAALRRGEGCARSKPERRRAFSKDSLFSQPGSDGASLPFDGHFSEKLQRDGGEVQSVRVS